MSRNDCQLDPSEINNGNPLPFYPVKCGKNDYKLQLEGGKDNIVDLVDLADEVNAHMPNVRIGMVESIINALCDMLPDYIARTGKAVRIGRLVTLKSCITGTIRHANDEADPNKNHVELRATEVPSLRYSLSRAKLVNAGCHTPTDTLEVVGKDGRESGVVNEIHETIVKARHDTPIYVPEQRYDGDGASGHAWLETLDGKCVGRFDVLQASEAVLRLKLHLEAKNAPSECRLAVETFGSKEASESGDARLMRYTRNVKLAR